MLAEPELGISLRYLQESPVLQDKQIKRMESPGVGEAPSVGHGVKGSVLVGVRNVSAGERSIAAESGAE